MSDMCVCVCFLFDPIGQQVLVGSSSVGSHLRITLEDHAVRITLWDHTVGLTQ